MSRGLRDILFGLFALAFAGVLWWETTKPQYLSDNAQNYGFDPAFFPRILIVLWALLAVSIVVRGTQLMRDPMPEQNWFPLAGSVLITTGYLSLMNVVGFLFSSIAFAAVLMPFLGFRRPIIVAVVSVLFPIAVWYSFVFLLKIPLPTSPWFTRI